MTDEIVAKDRYAGLVVAGILQILLGMMAAALALFVSAGFELAQRRSPGTAGGTLASALVVYGLSAVYFVAVGIGSIRARRWARALSVVVSGIWLAAGAAVTVMFAVLVRRAAAPLASVAVFGVAVPLVLFLFYRRRDVKETCERRDPKPRWTDRTPLPVLAVVLVVAFGSVAMLANLASPTLSLMGRVVTGAPAAITFFALAILGAYVAVQLYRLRETAWWTLILLQVAGLIYGGVTLAQSDFPAKRSPVVRDPVVIGAFVATWLAYFAFLLYLRRYFVGIQPRTRRGDVTQSRA